ncbi:unnamed protein product [Cochlearia groenlandica]
MKVTMKGNRGNGGYTSDEMRRWWSGKDVGMVRLEQAMEQLSRWLEETLGSTKAYHSVYVEEAPGLSSPFFLYDHGLSFLLVARHSAPVLLDDRAPVLLDDRAPVLLDDRAPVLLDDRAPVLLDDRAPVLLDDRAPVLLGHPVPVLLGHPVPRSYHVSRTLNQVSCNMSAYKCLNELCTSLKNL